MFDDCGIRRAALRGFCLVVLAALPCVGCATTVGTVAGPVTGPLSFIHHNHAMPYWLRVTMSPLLIPVGPFLGFHEGVVADLGYLQNGEYGARWYLSFEHVLDPAAPEGAFTDAPPAPDWPVTSASPPPEGPPAEQPH